ncbi:MAG: transglutaminase domain-containing protein, partial [Bdellovibrionales bacterium]|nr:transglutaminase domain-containing protein [Bdellovibrionales bacterium]
VQENFAYTLRPGKVTSLEDFLFSKKRGFCEHFAGAMASLLRLSGVPSRVVVGFQGGTSSLLRDYYLVRYLDAHAWVEYWDSLQKSWVRSDPIQFISPQRLAMGGESYRDMMNDRYFDVENSDLTQFLRGGLGEMASRVRLIWDQSESLWINFLLRYDWSFQKEIIQGLGLGEASRWIFAFLAIVLTLLALVVAIFVFRLGHDRVDPDLELYRLLCAHLSRFGLQKEVGEGPYDYWGRARNQFPQARDKLDSLFKALIHGRYGQLNLTRKMRRSLQHKIKRLRLQNESGRRSLSNS